MPCQNGATCEDDVDGFLCRCEGGFSRENCDVIVDDCSVPQYPCVELGTDEAQFDNGCLDVGSTFECACLPGFTGQTCDVRYRK